MEHRPFLPLDHPWRMNKMGLNNEEETREAPVPLSGQDVLHLYATIDHETRSKKDKTKKRKCDEDTRWHNSRKKSIFLSSPIGHLCSEGIIWT
jgi:hypothetical protein